MDVENTSDLGVQFFFRKLEDDGCQAHALDTDLRGYELPDHPVLCKAICKGVYDPAKELPGKEGWPKVSGLDEWMAQATMDREDILFLGRVAHRGRVIYYLHLTAESFELKGALMGKWPETELSYARDPKALIAQRELMPTDREYLGIRNAIAIRSMEAKNDDVEAVRPVCHFVGFRKYEDAVAFMSLMKEQGAQAEITEELNQGESLVEVMLEHACTPEEMDDVTWDLKEKCRKHRGSYVQWVARPVKKSIWQRLKFW